MDLDLSPAAFLSMWAGGIAMGTAMVTRWRIVGPGFFWLAAGAALLAGASTALVGGWALAATLAVITASVLARRPAAAAAVLAVAGLAYLIQAGLTQAGLIQAGLGNPLLILTGAVALGGTTCEMLLGHWYLVDPRLPRRSLRMLDGFGLAGLAADVLLVVALGGLAGDSGLRWVFLALAAVGMMLMVGVWFSLGEKGYEAVMAATGLSYLAVLTTLGSAAVGRFLL